MHLIIQSPSVHLQLREKTFVQKKKVAIIYFLKNVSYLNFDVLKHIINITVTYECLMFGISMKQTIAACKFLVHLKLQDFPLC
jgi:hypothetical protein